MGSRGVGAADPGSRGVMRMRDEGVSIWQVTGVVVLWTATLIVALWWALETAHWSPLLMWVLAFLVCLTLWLVVSHRPSSRTDGSFQRAFELGREAERRVPRGPRGVK